MLLLVLVLLLAAAPAARAERDPRPCRADLPAGPSVPAPVVFRSSCGGFLLDRDGRVTRLAPSWFATRSGGTGRRYGADLRIVRNRPGRIVLRRDGAVLWRSSALYRNDGGSVAFGPGRFAFAAFRRGVFLTDLRSPERLIVRGAGLEPLAFLRDGSLLVVDYRAAAMRVVAPDGHIARSHRYRPRNGYQFDQRTESLFFVTPGRVLVRSEGASVGVVRPLGALDGWIGLAGPYLTLSDFAHRGPSDEIGFAVLHRDGRLVSRWSWRSPRKARVDYGPVASQDGRTFAFRTVTTGTRPQVVVYVVREEEGRPAAVLRHPGRQMGCGVGASFGWRDRHVLYSATDGPAAIVDSGTGRTRSLSALAGRLPRRWEGERPTAHWLSDFVGP